MRRSSSPPDLLRKLLRKHRLHDGVYVRVAKRLRVHPSYVSKVAKGKAVSSEVSLGLLKELQRIERM
jgi:transcriptional regulator with XRE-family HTH domain